MDHSLYPNKSFVLLLDQKSADSAKPGHIENQKMHAGRWQDTPESHSRWRADCYGMPISRCKQANHVLVASITASAAHTLPLLMIALGDLIRSVPTSAAACTKTFAAVCTKTSAASSRKDRRGATIL